MLLEPARGVVVSPAKFLNTPYALESAELTLADYFARTPRIGSYAVVEVPIAPRERVRIVVDQNMHWLQKELDGFFKQEVKKLNLGEIERFLEYLRKSRRPGVDIAGMFGLSPHRSLTKSKFLNLFYLDDIAKSSSPRPLILSLVAQILIERYTKRESRLVVLQEARGENVFQDFAVLVKSQWNDECMVIDAGERFPRLRERMLSGIRNTVYAEDGEAVLFEILAGEFRVTHPRYGWNEKEKSFSIFVGNGREIPFQIVGRSTAERRFRDEEERLVTAADADLVPIEIAFHPFWRRLGHTTLRIGESLYELSSKGWRAHKEGQNSARAYLYNNPFFKQQYNLYKAAGMPPISIAVNVSVARAQALRLRAILDRLSAATGKEKEKFSLIRNNCNQGIMRVLEMADIPGFTSRGYLGFSSILSFRRLLLFPMLPVNGHYIYPLPGSEICEANLRRWVPRLVYRHNTSIQEMVRALPSLGVDMIAFGLRRFSDFIFERTKIRLWRGNEPYFMH